MAWGRDLIEGIGAGEQLAAPISDAIMFNKNKDLQQQQIDNTRTYQKGTLAAQAAALQQQGQLQGNAQDMQAAKELATDADGGFNSNAYSQNLQNLQAMRAQQAQVHQMQQQASVQQALKNVDVTHKDPSSGTTFKTTGDQAMLLAKSNPQVATMLGVGQDTSTTNAPSTAQGLPNALNNSAAPAPAAPSTQASGSAEAPAPVASSINSPAAQNTVSTPASTATPQQSTSADNTTIGPGYGSPQSATPQLPNAPSPQAVQDLQSSTQQRLAQIGAQRDQLSKMYVDKQIDTQQYNKQLEGLDLQQRQANIQRLAMDAQLAQQKRAEEHVEFLNNQRTAFIQAANSGLISPNTPNISESDVMGKSNIENMKQIPQSEAMPALNEKQADSLNFYNRLQQGLQTTDSLLAKKDNKGQQAFDPSKVQYSSGLIGNSHFPEAWKTNDYKEFQNAGNMIVQAIMRDDPKRDNPEAVEAAKQIYTIQPGDSSEVIAHKRGLIQSEMAKMQSALPLQVQRKLRTQNQAQSMQQKPQPTQGGSFVLKNLTQ